MNSHFTSRVTECVEHFDTDCQNYNAYSLPSKIRVEGLENNFVCSRDAPDQVAAIVNLKFHNSTNSRVFLGKNLRGTITINVRGSNSLIYVGDNCHLNQLEIRSFQSHDLIVVGNSVTTTATNTWISGNGAGIAVPAIIIGDDCMFSYDCVIRNSDAHPIFSRENDMQINCPTSAVIIEPHVWIGESAKILKDVVVGACSIIGLGAVVTKSIPRNSIATGVPAKSVHKPDLYWARSNSEQSKASARHYLEKYRSKGSSSSDAQHCNAPDLAQKAAQGR